MVKSQIKWNGDNTFKLAAIIVDRLDLNSLIQCMTDSVSAGYGDNKDVFEETLENHNLDNQEELDRLFKELK